MPDKALDTVYLSNCLKSRHYMGCGLYQNSTATLLAKDGGMGGRVGEKGSGVGGYGRSKNFLGCQWIGTAVARDRGRRRNVCHTRRFPGEWAITTFLSVAWENTDILFKRGIELRAELHSCHNKIFTDIWFVRIFFWGGEREGYVNGKGFHSLEWIEMVHRTKEMTWEGCNLFPFYYLQQ